MYLEFYKGSLYDIRLRHSGVVFLIGIFSKGQLVLWMLEYHRSEPGCLFISLALLCVHLDSNLHPFPESLSE